MSHAIAAPHATAAEKQVLGVTNGKMAMWIFLGSDGMSFMGLIATYVALRIGSQAWSNPTEILNINLTAVNTFILICSSVSMVKAYVGALEGDVTRLKRFLLLTILGGAAFLGIQVYEYHHSMTAEHLFSSGLFHPGADDSLVVDPASRLFGATFYVLTCFHGCHVLSGVIYLSCILIGVMRNRWTTNRIEIVGLYWHFVDLVWIVIFTIVYLIE